MPGSDDIMLYKPISSSSDFLAFQRDIDLVNLWMNSNHLDLNPAKTKFMLITRSTSHSKNCPSFYLNG